LKKGRGWMLIPAASESKQILAQFKRKDGKFEIQRTIFNIGGDPRASTQSSLMALQKATQESQVRVG